MKENINSVFNAAEEEREIVEVLLGSELQDNISGQATGFIAPL